MRSPFPTAVQLAGFRAAMAAGNDTTATVLRRNAANASIRGGEGGPFEESHTIAGRFRPEQGQEAATGGRLANTGRLEFLCAAGSDVTTRDRLRINGTEYEVADVDADRESQLVLVVTLRKAV